MKQKLAALSVAISVLLLQTSSFAAWEVVTAHAGHPLDNLARSNFSIFDVNVKVTGSTARTWVTPVQRVQKAGNVRAMSDGPIVVGTSASTRLCKYTLAGHWTGCTAWVSGNGGLATPYLSVGLSDTVHAQTSLANGGAIGGVAFELP